MTFGVIIVAKKFWIFKRFPVRQIVLLIIGIAAGTVALLLFSFNEQIGGQYQDAKELSLPWFITLSIVLPLMAVAELYFNRWRPSRREVCSSNGELFLDAATKQMCARYDAWCFGENSSGAAARYSAFAGLVRDAKVYPDTLRTEVYFDEDGKTLVFKAAKTARYNLHELVHIYQEITRQALTREREGRITIPFYVRAELEATWFAGQWPWTIGWIVGSLGFILFILGANAYAMMQVTPSGRELFHEIIGVISMT